MVHPHVHAIVYITKTIYVLHSFPMSVFAFGDSSLGGRIFQRLAITFETPSFICSR